jgi:selenocysteine-specific elongation factor
MASRCFILGTAGHVDHGKSKLVTCLTGWETDRLKEEKERGISIELGFAPLKLDGDTLVGIVDVPGHERFIKHMVAGAGGMDLAMLVIAADEGVMPQTREHLEVLCSLAVSHGVVVVTKSDLATDELRAPLKEEIDDLVKGTFLEHARIVETSAMTGAGMDALKGEIGRLTAMLPQRGAEGPFRLAIDRVFHMHGIGVVVTGSCYSGKVAVGDVLRVLPSEKEVRVREIQSFGEKREQGWAGERLAIALHGVKLGGIARGDMLVTPSHFSVSYMVDARIHLTRYAKYEVKSRERVRVHHGAREVLARIILLDTDTLRSTEECLAQLRLEQPIVAAPGDYFVLRKYSPSPVLGGGRIIDPNARKHRSNDADALAHLRIMEQGDSSDRLLERLHVAGVAGLQSDALDRADLDRLCETGRAVSVDKVVFHRDTLAVLREKVFELSGDYTKTHALRFGIDKEELRGRLRFPHPAPIFNRVLDVVAQEGGIFVRGNLVRVGTDRVELSGGMAEAVDILEKRIRDAAFLCQGEADLSEGWKGSVGFTEAVQFLRDSGRVHRIGDDLYIHNDAIESCLILLRRWFSARPTISVPEFKELLGVTRKQAVPLLEHLDASRYTIRKENVRVTGTRLCAKA